MAKIKIFFGTVICLLLFNTMAYATPGNLKEISIDGNFNDWKGYPMIKDDIGDTPKPHEDIEFVQCAADNNDLYLHIKRVGEDKYTYWNLKAVIVNGRKGALFDHKYYPNKSDRYPNQGTNPDNTKYVSFKAPQYDITVYYKDDYPKSNFYVKASFDDGKHGSTVIFDNVAGVSKDGKEFEIKLPLHYVGLNGANRDVKLMLKSGVFEPLTNVDWAPEKPITITKGTNAWEIFIGASFIFISFLAYKKLKK
ncbi:hypothetical protein SAMN02745163_01973 [Clostridium cavendishii DSM 21758]|uniref:Uncharacterized protein n=1 Tax=Clostridium cavendishii DSM 21758 TaxID=1121302 RepID=A0A1M6JB83_9CLOT|nr:hypothetical protein [Clostridium cavendishii]SHJ43945.1 hypothetical protein SAMN02745163_01973 [Clostridium cavendishii DSM 21758]